MGSGPRRGPRSCAARREQPAPWLVIMIMVAVRAPRQLVEVDTLEVRSDVRVRGGATVELATTSSQEVLRGLAVVHEPAARSCSPATADHRVVADGVRRAGLGGGLLDRTRPLVAAGLSSRRTDSAAPRPVIGVLSQQPIGHARLRPDQHHQRVHHRTGLRVGLMGGPSTRALLRRDVSRAGGTVAAVSGSEETETAPSGEEVPEELVGVRESMGAPAMAKNGSTDTRKRTDGNRTAHVAGRLGPLRAAHRPAHV